MFGDLQKDARAAIARLLVTAGKADAVLDEALLFIREARGELAAARRVREAVQKALGTTE